MRRDKGPEPELLSPTVEQSLANEGADFLSNEYEFESENDVPRTSEPKESARKNLEEMFVEASDDEPSPIPIREKRMRKVKK